MIIKTLTTTFGKVKVKIPQSLKDITMRQMIQSENMTDEEREQAEFDPIMPDLTRRIADNIVDVQDLSDLRERLLSLFHNTKYEYDRKIIPEYITFGHRKSKRFGVFTVTKENKVKVIKNLSIEPAGAFLASRDLISDEINRHIKIYGEDNWQDNFNPSLDVCAEILAHYFYCRVTGNDYSVQKAEQFKETILDLSVEQALPIARYFFLNYNNLYKPKMSLLKAFRVKLNNKLALRNLKNSRTLTQ